MVICFSPTVFAISILLLAVLLSCAGSLIPNCLIRDRQNIAYQSDCNRTIIISGLVDRQQLVL